MSDTENIGLFAGVFSRVRDDAKSAAVQVAKRQTYSVVGDWLAAVGGTLRTILIRALETDPRELIKLDRAKQTEEMNNRTSRMRSCLAT